MEIYLYIIIGLLVLVLIELWRFWSYFNKLASAVTEAYDKNFSSIAYKLGDIERRLPEQEYEDDEDEDEELV